VQKSPPRIRLNRPRVAAVALAALPCALTFALALGAGSARATDPAPLILDWQGPAECQAAPRVVAEVRRLLGREHAGSSLVVHARVERAGRRWHLALSSHHAGRATARALDAESCEAAADAAAVILALMIDPSRALSGPSDEEEPAREDERDAASSTVDAAAEDAPGPRRLSDGGDGDAARDLAIPGSRELEETDDAGDHPARLVLSAAAMMDTGTLPRTGFGFAGSLGLEAGLFLGEATFAYFPPVDSTVDLPAGRGGSFTMFAGSLRMCVLADAGALSFGPCAGGGLTWMHAEAFGVTTPIAADSSWGEVVANALLRSRISRYFSLRLTIGGAVPFSRPVFEVQGLGAVHQPAPIALQIGAGAEVHF
jgi:hypothetical protein